MTQPTVVISGAGIAGPALAHWLSATGYHMVVVELAPDIRPGGQTVDLRGAGRGVVERMQRWPFRGIAERKWFTTADAIELPDYPAP